MKESRTTGIAVVLLLGLLQSGCMLWKRGDAEVFEPAPITVAVENRNWSQVAIYVVAGGQRHRLGEVVGTSAGGFVLPGVFTRRTDVRLIAAPLASRQQYTTSVILVSPGSTIQLNVENVLSLSSWSVRAGY
jgi:hypothetical protein